MPVQLEILKETPQLESHNWNLQKMEVEAWSSDQKL